MTGTGLALYVSQRYRTTDLAELVQQAGVRVCYERWHPVTVGEYHKKTRTICINLNAPVPQNRILAHELGHFFIHETGLMVSRAEEETIADEFAEALLRYSNTFSMTSA